MGCFYRGESSSQSGPIGPRPFVWFFLALCQARREMFRIGKRGKHCDCDCHQMRMRKDVDPVFFCSFSLRFTPLQPTLLHNTSLWFTTTRPHSNILHNRNPANRNDLLIFAIVLAPIPEPDINLVVEETRIRQRYRGFKLVSLHHVFVGFFLVGRRH